LKAILNEIASLSKKLIVEQIILCKMEANKKVKEQKKMQIYAEICFDNYYYECPVLSGQFNSFGLQFRSSDGNYVSPKYACEVGFKIEETTFHFLRMIIEDWLIYEEAKYQLERERHVMLSDIIKKARKNAN
jgi:hypothetical protein